MGIENPAVVNDAQGEPRVFCGTIEFKAVIVFTFDESDLVTDEADARDRLSLVAEGYMRARLGGHDQRFELVECEVSGVELDDGAADG